MEKIKIIQPSQEKADILESRDAQNERSLESENSNEIKHLSKEDVDTLSLESLSECIKELAELFEKNKDFIFEYLKRKRIDKRSGMEEFLYLLAEIGMTADITMPMIAGMPEFLQQAPSEQKKFIDEYQAQLVTFLRSERYLELLRMKGLSEKSIEYNKKASDYELLASGYYLRSVPTPGKVERGLKTRRPNVYFGELDIIDGSEKTARYFLDRHIRPDMILMAPNSAIMPALIAKEVIESEEAKKTFGLDPNYSPYFFYPHDKSFAVFSDRFQEKYEKWTDADLLVDKYASPEAITDEQSIKIPMRVDTYAGEEIKETALNISLRKTRNKALRGVYEEMIKIADRIERQIEIRGKNTIAIVVFDEAFWTGTTSKFLRNMVKGATKILVKRGVIKSEKQVKVQDGNFPFGKHKPEFPSIELSEESDKRDELKGRNSILRYGPENKILFEFGRIIGRMLTEKICAEEEYKKGETAISQRSRD